MIKNKIMLQIIFMDKIFLKNLFEMSVLAELQDCVIYRANPLNVIMYICQSDGCILFDCISLEKFVFLRFI